MKIRKMLAMLLSFTLMSASIATIAHAEEPMTEDPGVTVKAEVTEVDQYGPYITITVTSDKFADPVMSGRSLSSVFGAAAVEVVLQLGDLFKTSGVNNDYMISAPEGTTTFAGQADNKVYASWGNASGAKYITNDTMKIVFAVDDADGVVNTVEEYNKNMGTVTSLFVTVKQYVDGALAYYAYVGDNSDCLFPGKTIVGTQPAITPVDPAVTAVTIDPTTATVNGGESTTFTATVEGTDGNDDKGEVVALDKSVTWTATAGTIVGGVFTAPEATEAEQTITVTATSVADTSKSASAIVTVPKAVPADKDPVVESVTVTPATATVEGGATETFTAVVDGQTGLKGGVEVAVPQDVEWTATAGTIVDGVFTAPAATDAEQTITITATAKGTSVSGTATVTVPAKVVVVTTTVTVTDAKATQSSAFKNQNTMYWGVTISNGLKGDVTAQLEAEDEQSKVTTLDFSEVTINGDAVFGVYTKVAAKRLDKAIKLVITDVASGVVGESSAASYNSLLK